MKLIRVKIKKNKARIVRHDTQRGWMKISIDVPIERNKR